MKTCVVSVLVLSSWLVCGPVRADAVEDLLAEYRGLGGGPFQASAGEALWLTQHTQADGSRRSCTSCHTNEPRQPGRHNVTGRGIEPLAPSVNPRRLTERREIEKWFKRNCKWTLGRECTVQEKGDLLAFLRHQ